jgi:hypothetical protein
MILYRSGEVVTSKLWILDADTETGVLTWMSVLGLFAAASLFFLNGKEALSEHRSRVLPWFILAVVFGLMSFDEFYGLHEKLSGLVEGAVRHLVTGQAGLLYFAWAAPAGVLAVLGLILILPFLASLGRRTCRLIYASAALFLGGAVVMEMLGGRVAEAEGVYALKYRLFVNVEEGLELLGILLLLYALSEYRERVNR